MMNYIASLIYESYFYLLIVVEKELDLQNEWQNHTPFLDTNVSQKQHQGNLVSCEYYFLKAVWEPGKV